MIPPKPLEISAKEWVAFQVGVLKDLRQAFELHPASHMSFYKIADTGRSSVEEFDLRGSRDLEDLAEDLRGQTRDVIPIQRAKGWTVLLGLRFSWRRSAAKYQYKSSQIILFLRSEAEEEPKQFLRLEWEGYRPDGTFEASHAAHPHWQIDIVRRSVAPNEPHFPRHGVSFVPRPPLSRPPHWLPKIHFAAAADWAATSWAGKPDSPAHAAGPGSVDELSRWTSSACWYLNAQLAAALAGS